ncbi:MAG: helicase C-terminal domain-containing protein [Promethearchaeota archaeon]
MNKNKILPEAKIYFPYSEVRDGQDIAINNIYNALKEEKHVVISAPNGFGKTITVLSSVLPIIKETENEIKIIYLCRTHIQSQHVIRELNKVIKHLKKLDYGLNLGGISLRGRASMCFHPKILQYAQDPLNSQLMCREIRNMNKCSYDLNIKDKPEQLKNLLQQLIHHAVEASELLEICRNWAFCPYQVSKLVLYGMDIIVGSYQWLFSPFIREYFLENIDTALNKIILILDEAHNVPEVAREIASNQLTEFSVTQMISEAESLENLQIINFGTNLLEIMNDLKEKISDEFAISSHLTSKKVFKNLEPSSFIKQLIQLGEIWRQKRLKEGKNPHSFIYFVGMFWMNWLLKQKFNSYFFCASKFYTRTGNESIKLEIISLDPKDILGPILEQVHSSISLSGTLEPIPYYSDMIGLPKDSVELSLPSPFQKENILTLTMKTLSTRGNSRTEEMYKKYVSRCIEAVEAIPKNVGIFTASYDVLQGLLTNGIIKKIKNKEIFYEERKKTSIENDQMIAKYKLSAKKKGGVLIGVCGGRNAEGEDFPGDLMNGVILCGIPFAKPTARIKALIDYYGGSQKGKDYAYNMPAFRRANQAAGRPIRTITDKGVIILLDYRYNFPFYKKFLNPWLRNRIISLPDEPGQLAAKIQKFWN